MDIENSASCAVLYHMSHMDNKPAFTHTSQIMIKGRYTVQLPMGKNFIDIPGSNVGVRLRVMTTMTTTDAKLVKTSKQSIDCELRANNMETILAFLSKVVAEFDAVVAAEPCEMVHYKFRSCDDYVMYSGVPNSNFDTLFLPRAQEVRAIVKEFQLSKQRCAELGKKCQLSLMLEGERKTSMAIAISHLLNRKLVTIPLNNIETLQELELAINTIGVDLCDEDFSKVVARTRGQQSDKRQDATGSNSTLHDRL